MTSTLSHSRSQCERSFFLDNSIFSSTPSTSFIDSAENFQPHNPYLKRPNHTVIKMSGRINGQPISQSAYNLNSYRVADKKKDDDELKREMENIQNENKELKLRIRTMEDTIMKINLEKKKGANLLSENKENSGSFKSKLNEREQHYIQLQDSYCNQRDATLKMEMHIEKYKHEIKKLQQELIASKS